MFRLYLFPHKGGESGTRGNGQNDPPRELKCFASPGAVALLVSGRPPPSRGVARVDNYGYNYAMDIFSSWKGGEAIRGAMVRLTPLVRVCGV